MTSPRLLFDTNVISWYLDRNARTRHPAFVHWMERELSQDGLHISVVTLYEIRRGIVELLNRGQGARKAARLEMLLRQATVHGLDANDHLGWKLAADLWARAKASEPALVIADADLLITATAIAHDRVLATVDEKLRVQLARLNMQAVLHDVPVS